MNCHETICLSVGLISASIDRGIDEYKGQNICHECGEVIFHLVQVRSEVVDYKMFLDSAIEFDSGRFVAFTEIGSRDDGEVIHYECPICEEVVCYSLNEAEAILRGKTKHQQDEALAVSEGIRKWEKKRWT